MFGEQKSGDSSEYMMSFLPGLFMLALSGIKLSPSLLAITFAAPSNLSLSLSPISLKVGILHQQVLKVHDPESPWHLHSTLKWFLIANLPALWL